MSDEDFEMYFDDVKITHTYSNIVAGGDFYPYGLAIKDRQIDREKYRFGYQGQFAEKDLETGWNHFELREYDPVIARWMSYDPEGQYWSPYVGVGNDPVTGIDPDGGREVYYDAKGAWVQTLKNNFFHNLFHGTIRMIPDGSGNYRSVSYDYYWSIFVDTPGAYQGEFSTKNDNFWAANKKTLDNSSFVFRIPGNAMYSVADDAYMSVMQTGRTRYHLDGYGASNEEVQEGGANTMMFFLKKGVSSKVLTASEFSSKFKGSEILNGSKKAVGYNIKVSNQAVRAAKSSKNAFKQAKRVKYYEYIHNYLNDDK